MVRRQIHPTNDEEEIRDGSAAACPQRRRELSVKMMHPLQLGRSVLSVVILSAINGRINDNQKTRLASKYTGIERVRTMRRPRRLNKRLSPSIISFVLPERGRMEF